MKLSQKVRPGPCGARPAFDKRDPLMKVGFHQVGQAIENLFLGLYYEEALRNGEFTVQIVQVERTPRGFRIRYWIQGTEIWEIYNEHKAKFKFVEEIAKNIFGNNFVIQEIGFEKGSLILWIEISFISGQWNIALAAQLAAEFGLHVHGWLNYSGFQKNDNKDISHVEMEPAENSAPTHNQTRPSHSQSPMESLWQAPLGSPWQAPLGSPWQAPLGSPWQAPLGSSRQSAVESYGKSSPAKDSEPNCLMNLVSMAFLLIFVALTALSVSFYKAKLVRQTRVTEFAVNPYEQGDNLTSYASEDFSNLQKSEYRESPCDSPEPCTIILLGSGMVLLACFRKKFRKK